MNWPTDQVVGIGTKIGSRLDKPIEEPPDDLTDHVTLTVSIQMYADGKVFEYFGDPSAARIDHRVATHGDELLAADIREAILRDAQRRQSELPDE